ncbi:hypothetical protein GF361_04955 [Candidatus Woesearchaeota archaeon]|nr:hypothetical protein [Candidatus Woesearchaeota archaeon]
MAYHFFERWKEIKSDVFSIKDELNLAEKVYKIKIKLFKNIWFKLEERKIDHRKVSKLNKIYNKPKYTTIYQLIIKKLEDISSIDLLSDEEIKNFRDMIFYLNKNNKKEIEIARGILDELEKGKIPEKNKFRELQELLLVESEYLKIEDEKFNKIERVFLAKQDPGAGTGGYIPLVYAVKKGIVKVKGHELFARGKPIQGMTIHHNMIMLKGDHYSSIQNVKWIEGNKHVSPSTIDPFSYFVEKGILGGKKQHEIKRILGAKSAEGVVSLVIEIFPEQIYIKIKRKDPIKFAVVNLKRSQVIEVVKESKPVPV